MELIAEVLIIGFAAWRVASLISYEKGPFNIFVKFRSVLGFTHDDGGSPAAWPSGFLPELVSCMWCLSLWAAAAMWGMWQLSESFVVIVAASSTLLALERWNRGD